MRGKTQVHFQFEHVLFHNTFLLKTELVYAPEAREVTTGYLLLNCELE